MALEKEPQQTPSRFRTVRPGRVGAKGALALRQQMSSASCPQASRCNLTARGHEKDGDRWLSRTIELALALASRSDWCAWGQNTGSRIFFECLRRGLELKLRAAAAGVTLIAFPLLLFLAPDLASARDANGTSSERFNWSDLVPAFAALAGAAVGAAASIGAARVNQRAEDRRQRELRSRSERERIAMDARTLADDGATVQERIAYLIRRGEAVIVDSKSLNEDESPELDAAREELRKSIAELRRRNNFVLDEELRSVTAEFIAATQATLRAKSAPERRTTALRAGARLDLLLQRSGAVYQKALAGPFTQK